MMNIINEKITRKMDATGRVSIPSYLKEKFNINPGDEMEVAIVRDGQGSYYVAFKTGVVEENADYAVAAGVLEALGCEIPDALKSKLA